MWYVESNDNTVSTTTSWDHVEQQEQDENVEEDDEDVVKNEEIYINTDDTLTVFEKKLPPTLLQDLQDEEKMNNITAELLMCQEVDTGNPLVGKKQK